jgi:hypothetical protein
MMDVRTWRFDVPRGRLDAVKARHEARQVLFEAGFSRRRFLRTSIGAPALVMAAGSLSRADAAHNCGDPQPIPDVLEPGPGLPDLHVQLPGIAHGADTDPSTITDFNGHLGYAVIDGVGVRTDLGTHTPATMPFEVDLRFMKGEFITEDGGHCHGAFALV